MAAIFGFDDIGNHAHMLLDSARVTAFADALAEVVTPADVVADIGAGSGLLAIIAARCGARRVFAVERGPLAHLIEHAARDNGVADIVEVLRADARDVVFPEPPTIIVSETLGSFGIDEDILGLIKTVRARASASCRVIPEHFEVELALAFVPALADEMAVLEGGLPVRFAALRAALLSRVTVALVDEAHFASTIARTGVLRVGDDVLPRIFAGPVQAERTGEANAIVAWFSAQLSPSVSLRSGPGPAAPSWYHLVFPLDPPLPIEQGQLLELEVRPRVVTDRGTWAWRAGVAGAQRTGDAMKSLVGDKDDLLRQLGLRAKTLDPRESERLAVWATALDGGVADTATMGRRLREAFPARFADDADAAQEILRLVRVANG